MSTFLFDTLAERSVYLNEKDDCAVKAFAIIAGLTYDEAHDLLGRHGRLSRQATKDSVLVEALRHCGVELHRYDGPVPKTVKKAREKLDPAHDYLIWTAKHVLPYMDGQVHDWTADRCHRPVRIRLVIRTQRYWEFHEERKRRQQLELERLEAAERRRQKEQRMHWVRVEESDDLPEHRVPLWLVEAIFGERNFEEPLTREMILAVIQNWQLGRLNHELTMKEYE
jgi:hypothetical protein